MKIAQLTAFLPVRERLSPQISTLLDETISRYWIEITEGDFSEPISIGRYWSDRELWQEKLSREDEILVDPNQIPHSFLSWLSFEDSSRRTDWGALIFVFVPSSF